MTIQRYDIDGDPHPSGRWVEYTDHLTALAEAVRELSILRAVFGLNESDKSHEPDEGQSRNRGR